MTVTPFDVVLLVAVVAVALAAVAAPRRVTAVSAFLVLGVVLAVLWARLEAPDVALAEAALGGGVAGALLVDALGSPRPPAVATTASGRPRALRVARVVVAAALGAGVGAGLLSVVRHLPAEPAELATTALDAVPESGVDHPITAVLLNYRSLDTLLEVAVLAVAALAATSLVRGRVVAPAEPPAAVRALAVVLLPVLVLLACWVLFAGTTRPGGAFQAGAILGAGLVVAHLAGVRVAGPRGRVGAAAVVLGVVAFVAVAVGTAVLGDGWLVLDVAWAGTVVLALEAVLAVGIAAGLAATFLAARADDVAEQPQVPAEGSRP